MKTKRKSHIALSVCAVFAAIVLLATYGTVLPSAPFAPVQLNGPTVVDSDGEFTGVVDTESRRALILNANDDLTGVVSCTIADAPFDAITDVCVSDGLVFFSGVRYEPDSDAIAEMRVAAYDKGGNFQGVVYERKGEDASSAILSLSDVPKGVAVAYGTESAESSEAPVNMIAFDLISGEGISEIGSVESGSVAVFDAALTTNDDGEYRFATLSARGILADGESDFVSQVHEGHVFTSVDIDADTLYVCDDETGALCALSRGSTSVDTLVDGAGYHSVHKNNDVISLCNSETNKVTLCDASGTITSEFTEVTPSIGFSLRMLVVWASGLYLAILALVLAIRKIRQLVREGKTESIGPMFTAVAIVAAIAVAIGSLSFASYQKLLDLRANEIGMCADYIEISVFNLSEVMEKADDRDGLRKTDEELFETATNAFTVSLPAWSLVQSANDNGIGMYFTLYGKDDKGIFYFFGSSPDYVMGTSARNTAESGLQAAFDGDYTADGELLEGKTLRDTAQYRLVPIPSADGKSVVGVIEVGSKMRSFESSITGDLAQQILALLVMVLVVYLGYSELRACGQCLFSYRQRQQASGARAVAVLTRPFTLAITMLTSIDSVMTVLIARDLLTNAGMGDSTPLMGVPAVMLGAGLIIGQALYGIVGPRVGLRRLVITGAFVMLVCACFTGAAVFSGVFWLYCAAKLAMAVPFGMLYSLGYSLPRLAADDETRALAAGGVRRTDTSAAALGTVLGGYAAQALGNVWVYALVAVACLPVILMALNLLPRGMQPLEKLAQPDSKNGHVFSFVKTAPALALALFIVLPATLAAGYASFLFPVFASDFGLSKANINNIYVLGQLVVFVLIGSIDRVEKRHGKWKVSSLAIALLGLVFLLFAINTTLVWSVAVIAIVAVLCKASDGWKAMWLKAAGEADVPAGRATSAMFATRSLALVAQPFILSGLLGATNSIAVIVIGLICAACAGLFFLITRRNSDNLE